MKFARRDPGIDGLRALEAIPARGIWSTIAWILIVAGAALWVGLLMIPVSQT